MSWLTDRQQEREDFAGRIEDWLYAPYAGEPFWDRPITKERTMACETCDHTMQRVNEGQPPVFWCPRCGTIKTEGEVPEFKKPMFVDRATNFRELMQRVAWDLEDAQMKALDRAKQDTKEAFSKACA